MSNNTKVPDGTYKLSSIEANIIAENVGKTVKVSLDNERAFYGILESYDESYLFLKNNDRPILIKRRKISSLAVV